MRILVRIAACLLANLCTATTVWASIVVTVDPPILSYPDVGVSAHIESTLPIVRAQPMIGPNNGSLRYTVAGEFWTGSVYGADLPYGQNTLTVTATDVNGNTGSGSVTFVRGSEPRVSVSSPLPFTVGRPTVRVIATCADDSAQGCTVLRVRSRDGSILAQSANPAAMDMEIQLPKYPTAQWLQIEGLDSDGHLGYSGLDVERDTSAHLRLVATAPGAILDFDGFRVLYSARANRSIFVDRLGIYDVATGTSEEIPLGNYLAVIDGRLTPYGCLFVATDFFVHAVIEWRDGALQPAVTNSFRMGVEGNWSWIVSSDRLLVRNLLDGSERTIDTGEIGDADLDADGNVVYDKRVAASSYDVYLV